jgi:DNA-directed RNA polymerase subunit K/omega
LEEVENGKAESEPGVSKEEILKRAPSAYEAVVAMAKEARRLNAAPEVFLRDGGRALPRAVRNFVGGKVEYSVEETGDPDREFPGTGRRAK